MSNNQRSVPQGNKTIQKYHEITRLVRNRIEQFVLGVDGNYFILSGPVILLSFFSTFVMAPLQTIYRLRGNIQC